MATAPNGPLGHHQGKVGNIVYYMLNGQPVARNIGRSTKPPTEDQKQHRRKLKVVNTFLKTFKDFINIGFQGLTRGTKQNAFNLASKANFHHILKGEYPDYQIDYSRLMLSQGPLKPAANASVKVEGDGLLFNWETDPMMLYAESTEQAMLLAYFPEEEQQINTPFGALRQSGTAVLPLPENLREAYMEVYISFISADRSQVADSVYLGSLNGHEQED
ncbi:DUF6266 family protein [Pedobacter faecalis]|uniref:DUF6266 family protein n=1 Tax=Pedobacter faecalis TaxID=3041495 RepID=UPI0025508C4A|nr:DUF6266 family protein [Pedobacter sp. ELA7]